MEKSKHSFSNIHGRRSILDLRMSVDKSHLFSNKTIKEADNFVKISQRNKKNVIPKEFIYSTEMAEDLSTVKSVKVIDTSNDTSNLTQFDIIKSNNRNNIIQESENLEKSQRNPVVNNFKITEKQCEIKNSPKKNPFSEIFILVAVVSMVIGCFVFNAPLNTNDIPNEIEVFDLAKEIIQIKNEFPAQNEDLWTSFISGIDDTIQLSKPSVFLLLHSGLSNTSKKIAQKVAAAASKALRANVKQPLEIDSVVLSNELFLKDHGNIITKFTPELAERRVMIVNNLDEVPGKVARGFHNFCDKEAPLVEKSIIIFIMKSDYVLGDSVVLAENVLKEKWSEHLDDDILFPLLARFTDAVYTIV